jgi:hypothetical protein
MNEINGFTFYRDFYNLIDTMSINDRKELAVAILDYVFKDEIPNLNGHNQAIFNTLSRQLDKSKNKSKNAKRNQIDSQTNNQNEIKMKSNENQNEIKLDNKTSIFNFKFYISNFKFINSNNLLISKIEEWLKYKQERNEYYKDTGIKSLLKKIDSYVELYGDKRIINLIDDCMANNYKGIIYEKITESPEVYRPQKVCKEHSKERNDILDYDWLNDKQEDVNE